MTEPIKPAMTPEQWAEGDWSVGSVEKVDELEVRVISASEREEDDGLPLSAGLPLSDSLIIVPSVGLGGGATQDVTIPQYSAVDIGPQKRHALAAVALYGQPFGFTWEDVDELRGAANVFRPDRKEHLESLADRIAALLPPRPNGFLGMTLGGATTWREL